MWQSHFYHLQCHSVTTFAQTWLPDSWQCFDQGSKGIRQFTINQCISQMMMHKIIPSVDYNQGMKRLDTKHNEPTNQSLIKAPQIVKPTNKKTLFKTLGTKVINCPMPNVLF